MLFSAIASSFLLAASASNCVASLIDPQSLLVFNPRIISPEAGVIWVPGTAHNVTWDTSDIPNERQGTTGLILLGYNGTYSENLDITHPLASSFPIKRGHTLVTLPKNTKFRDDYFIVLFGDSGNRSHKFKVRPHYS
ncbi:hypothetical protein H2248_007778 [Termitomyces sp. 'cryptogamus']|nr:hypothetical protein H2248_007778 [Termitomyces sp. 'cryptogamus']